jgi:hypothetical protein
VDKWFVKVTGAQLEGLRNDMRDLGTLLTNEQGENYLVFRDSFVALKVASSMGLQAHAVRVVPGQKSYNPVMTLENSDILVPA